MKNFLPKNYQMRSLLFQDLILLAFKQQEILGKCLFSVYKTKKTHTNTHGINYLSEFNRDQVRKKTQH